MYPISAEVAELFANNRQVVMIELSSSTDVYITRFTEANIKTGGLVIDRTCVSGDSIEIGSVIASELKLELNNTNGQFNNINFEGGILKLYVGTKDWSDESASVQLVPMGRYYIEGSPRKLDTISLTALDSMVKLDVYVDWTIIQFPITAQNLMRRIGAICHISFETLNFLNNDYVITSRPEGDNITYRQLVAWVCEISGTCAYFNYDFLLKLCWFGESQESVPSIPPSVRYNSDIEENAITLTGIRIVTDDNVYLAGIDNYALTIEGNPLIQHDHQALADSIYNARGGLTYTPFAATVKSMPYLYPLDKVNFVKGETSIPTLITNMNFALNNSTVLEGKGKTQIENNYAELNPMTTQQKVILDKLHSKTVQEFKAADGELLSTIANSESKYDESTSPGTITLRGYGAPADAGYPAADHNGAYYLDEMTGFVYLSDGTSWSKVAELNLITTQLDTKIEQTAEGMLFSASQMFGGERTKNLIPFVLTSDTLNGITITRSGTGFKLTGVATSNAYFTLYTTDGSTIFDNSKLPNTKTLSEGTYIVSGEGFGSDIKYYIERGTSGSNYTRLCSYSGETDGKLFTVETTLEQPYVRHYVWIRSGTDMGSNGTMIYPMIRDASIADDTYTEGIDTGAYMCSAINLTPEKLELDAGKLIINSGNFQLDENGVLTSTAGKFKTSDYTPASGSTKTVGGQIDLGATGSDLIFDTANFKVSGGGAVSAEDANFKNCTIEGGSFEVDSTEQSGQVTNRINLINRYSGDQKQVNISAEKIELSRSFAGASGDISLDFANGSEIRLASQLGPDYDRAVYSANKIKFDVDTAPNTANISYVDANDTEQVVLSLGRNEVTLGNSNVPLNLLGTYISISDALFISNLIRLGRSTTPLLLNGSQVNLSSPSVTINDRPVATSDEIEARLEATVGHSSKNLLDIDGFDDTQYNVHGYSENGYFRLVGTYQSDGVHQFFRIYFKLPAGSYILSGAPDYSTTPIRIAMCTYASNPNDYTTIGYDQGNNLSFTLNEDSNCFIAFRFHSGIIGVPIDLTLPVMIRSASISDDTFEPYVTPTDERIASLEAQVAALTALINGR